MVLSQTGGAIRDDEIAVGKAQMLYGNLDTQL